MRVKKCPMKIVVVEVEEDESCQDGVVANFLPPTGRLAPANIKEKEPDEYEDMPVLYTEAVLKEELTEEKSTADVSDVEPNNLHRKRRRDVQMEETEYLKCIAHGFPGRQLRHQQKTGEGTKPKVGQPAAKRKKKEIIKPSKPFAALNAAKKHGQSRRSHKREEDEKLQRSVMSILNEAKENIKKEVADGILKQKIEFERLWKSRISAAKSDTDKCRVESIKSKAVKKKSFTKKPRLVKKRTTLPRKRGRPRKRRVGVVAEETLTTTKLAVSLVRTRSRVVKPVDRYGAGAEQRRLQHRKSVAMVKSAKEGKKTKQKRNYAKPRAVLAKIVPSQAQEAIVEKIPSIHKARLPRKCRKDCAIQEETVLGGRDVNDPETTVDKAPLDGCGDLDFSLGSAEEDLGLTIDVESIAGGKKESPPKKSHATKALARKAGGKAAGDALVPQRKHVHELQQSALVQRQKANVAKELEREAKKAAREAKRQMKLEEQQKKREARRLKREMKEKLLKEKRERREAERKKLEEERLARKKKKKGAVAALKSAEEAQKVFIPSPCDGVVPIADLSFCYRIFVSGKVFLNRWLILDEIPSHRYGVAAYLVVENAENKTQGILYVQDANNPFAGLPEEVYFLQTQSERNRSYLFHTVVDAHFVSATAQSPTFFYYVIILRESASLKDIWTHYPEPKESNEKKAWSPGTVGRLASDILSIIEVTYEAGYTFRNIDISHFHLDLRTRRLYLDNAIEAVVSTELKGLRLKSGEYVFHNYWRGCVEYAPLSWHQNGRESIMRVADCAEVLFYMMVDMLGLLTWRGLDDRQTMVCKEGFVEQNRKKLPVPLIDYWKVVRRAQAIDTSKLRRQDDYLLLDGIRGGATVSVLDFRTLFMRLLTMYKVFGGVLDEDTPYDFEVVDDPTKRCPEQQRLIQLFEEAEFLRYKLEVLSADYDALMTRKEFAKRNAAQTKRERALAIERRYDPKDRVQDHRDAGDFSSEDSDDD